MGWLSASKERRKEQIAEYNRKYYEEHKEEIKQASTRRQKNNKGKYYEYQKDYYARNSKRIQEQRREHLKEKILNLNKE